jgi:glycosyltransferase involved in cell wall biosynthesis
MRLLITLDFPPEHGGIQRHLQGIVSHTFTKDDAVLVGCRRVPQAGRAAERFLCPVMYCSTVFSRANKKWSLVPLFVRCLRMRHTLGPSLSVECGNVYAGIAPWLVSLFMPVRYCVYVHGTELVCLHKATPAGAILKNVLNRANRIIANSSYTASLVHAICPARPVDIVTPKIDLPSPEKQLLGKDPGGILCVGRLVCHKGHDVLLEAVSQLPRDRQWDLVIAGNGPLLSSLTRKCIDLGIADRVMFKTGLVDKELEQEYQRASIFVLPTVPVNGTEGFGIVLLEAMAHRLPIIASNIGGVAEVLDKGSCGVLVEPGDVQRLCDAIRRVADDASLREAITSSALERLRKNYVWQ